ncbi:hypothetical protein D3C72_2094420 [compost metagenome]
MSRAVVTCAGSGRPLAFLNTVRLMPSALALRVIISPKAGSLPASVSPITTAASLAESTTMPMTASRTVIWRPAPTASLNGSRPLACSETVNFWSHCRVPFFSASKAR